MTVLHEAQNGPTARPIVGPTKRGPNLTESPGKGRTHTHCTKRGLPEGREEGQEKGDGTPRPADFFGFWIESKVSNLFDFLLRPLHDGDDL